MLKPGTRVIIDKLYGGTIQGYGFDHDKAGDPRTVYLVRLTVRRLAWADTRIFFVSMVVAHPDNVEEVPEES